MSREEVESGGRCSVEVVFFDVGGTILRANPSVGEIYARRAADHGFSSKPEELNGRFRVAWGEYLVRSRSRAFRCDDETLRGDWFQIVSQTFAGDVPSGAMGALFEDLYEYFVYPDAWTLVPGTRQAFETLRDRGMRLGVISNWDKRLRETLEGIGLLELFEPELIKISHEVGFEKPHDAMFEAARESAGVDPARILHVGDSLEADIAPAAAHGLRTFWVSDDDPPASGPCPTAQGSNFSQFSAGDWDSLLG